MSIVKHSAICPASKVILFPEGMDTISQAMGKAPVLQKEASWFQFPTSGPIQALVWAIKQFGHMLQETMTSALESHPLALLLMDAKLVGVSRNLQMLLTPQTDSLEDPEIRRLVIDAGSILSSPFRVVN